MLMLKELRLPDRSSLPPGSRPRRKSWLFCQHCLSVFVAPRLSSRYCSRSCKTAAQATGQHVFQIATPAARLAHSIVRNHLRAGLLHRPATCEECGVTGRRIEAAHHSYAEPLRIRWLCRSCHVRWDKQVPKGGTLRITINEQTPALAGVAGEA